MSWQQVITLVTIIAVVDFITVTTILRMATSEFVDLNKSFPAREPAPDAVRKNFQSFKVGMISLGGCIHVAVDEQHLHLFPSRVARWLTMKPLSIPWDAIRLKKRGKRSTTVKINKADITGPTWCLELAEPEASAGSR